MSNGMLPDYVSMAKPNPAENRAPWYKNTAPTYAGIFLWFVFWSQAPSGGGSGAPGGVLGQGIGVALLGLVVAALLCHFLFYLVPGLLGMKTGLPLYVIGTSTYGAQGGFLMPGFLMGVLQFGWLGVNSYFASLALAPLFGGSAAAAKIIAVLWAIVAAFVGLKGIQYVAKVATLLPLIPLVILLIMVFKALGGIGDFNADALITAGAVEGGATSGLSFFGVMALSISFVVGFFATAGAAGVDFGMNSKDERDVQMGGLFGVALAAIVAAGAAILIAAGAFGATGKYAMNPADAGFIGDLMGSTGAGKAMALLLAVAAFPPACFSAFIAANSFKTTLPKVNPFISVGIGTAVSIILAGQSVYISGDWYCGEYNTCRNRLGRQGRRRLYRHRCFIWSGLWCDDGRLSHGREEMGRAAGRLEPRRLDFLGGWLYRRNCSAGWSGQYSSGTTGSFHRWRRALLHPGKSRT